MPTHPRHNTDHIAELCKLAARGESTIVRVPSAAGADVRRRGAGDMVASSRSANTADVPASLPPRALISLRKPHARGLLYFHHGLLARISHQLSTAAADPGMYTALRSFGLLDILSSMPAGPLRNLHAYTWREAPSAMPVCTASLRNLVRNAG
jgi:hypothetical protein